MSLLAFMQRISRGAPPLRAAGAQIKARNRQVSQRRICCIDAILFQRYQSTALRSFLS